MKSAPEKTANQQIDKSQLAGYKAPAVHKAFQIIKTVVQSSESLGLVQLSERLGYSKSTTHGLVHALLREGVLTQGPGGRKLFLGPMIAELMFSTWDQEKVIKLAQPLLEEIRDAINETVILGARIRHRVLILSVAEAFDSLKISIPVGSTIPLIAGAVGKALLSTESPDLATTMIQKYGLRTYTPRSITDPVTYMAELERVRESGHAVDIEEYLPGIKAVAVALHNLQGLPIAIWVVGMSANIDMEKISRIANITKEQAALLREMVDRTTFR